MKLRKALALILLSILGLGLPIFGLSVLAHAGDGSASTPAARGTALSQAAGEQRARAPIQLASLLRGGRLVTAEGAPAGQVLDLVVDPRANLVLALLVALPQRDGAPAQVTALPFELVELEVTPDGALWRVRHAAAETAPRVDFADEESFRLGGWLQPMRAHFGLPPLTEPAGEEAPPRPGLVPSRALEVGARGRTGEDLGRVDEIAFDVAGARIAYVVVGRQKGVLGLRARRAAVPWVLARLVQSSSEETPHAAVISLAVDDAALEAAPRFQPDDMERMGDPRYLRELFDHFGVDPAGLERAGQRSGAAPDAVQLPDGSATERRLEEGSNSKEEGR